MPSKPSRTAIRRALLQLDQKVQHGSDGVAPVARAPSVRGVSVSNAIDGLKSGEYVLLNRALLRHIIEELSK